MKILNSIAYLMLTIAILSNYSYTMDDQHNIKYKNKIINNDNNNDNEPDEQKINIPEEMDITDESNIININNNYNNNMINNHNNNVNSTINEGENKELEKLIDLYKYAKHDLKNNQLKFCNKVVKLLYELIYDKDFIQQHESPNDISEDYITVLLFNLFHYIRDNYQMKIEDDYNSDCKNQKLIEYIKTNHQENYNEINWWDLKKYKSEFIEKVIRDYLIKKQKMFSPNYSEHYNSKFQNYVDKIYYILSISEQISNLTKEKLKLQEKIEAISKNTVIFI